MNKSDRDVLLASVGAFVVLVVIGCLWTVAAASFESSAYNRLTGAHTTWWDAVWLDLRVQDTPK